MNTYLFIFYYVHLFLALLYIWPPKFYKIQYLSRCYRNILETSGRLSTWDIFLFNSRLHLILIFLYTILLLLLSSLSFVVWMHHQNDCLLNAVVLVCHDCIGILSLWFWQKGRTMSAGKWRCLQWNIMMDDDIVVHELEAASPYSVVLRQLRISSPL